MVQVGFLINRKGGSWFLQVLLLVSPDFSIFCWWKRCLFACSLDSNFLWVHIPGMNAPHHGPPGRTDPILNHGFHWILGCNMLKLIVINFPWLYNIIYISEYVGVLVFYWFPLGYFISQMLHGAGIFYQHLPQKWPSFVGKYSSTMEDLGIGWVHSFSDSWLLRGLHFAKLPPGSMKVFAGDGMGVQPRDSPSCRFVHFLC